MMCHLSVAPGIPVLGRTIPTESIPPTWGHFSPLLRLPIIFFPSSFPHKDVIFLFSFLHFSLCSSWLSSVLTRNSLTSAGIHPLPAPLAPLEMICSTGKRPSWVLVTPHTLAVSSSLPSTSLPITPSSLPRSTSPLASITPTSTPTAASVWTS